MYLLQDAFCKCLWQGVRAFTQTDNASFSGLDILMILSFKVNSGYEMMQNVEVVEHT